ncbi:MAG TPA: ACP S-malonyltransferase [Bacillota bacterium]|nr:ACP S-malonyltransferase [Bacillota bacterium]
MKRVAFMFPGQGSQNVGMGKQFYDADPDVAEMFHQADQLLDKPLTNVMFNGPKETLTATENAQPALLLASMAAHTQLVKEGIEPVMAVGHSLGEYSALVAAGSLTFAEAIPLVNARGRLMEEAFPGGEGTMAAVIGLDEAKIQQTLAELDSTDIVDIANLNCPGQIVISGTKKGIRTVTPLLKERGARRVIPLNVSGPFHSRLMASANEALTEKLNNIHIQDATIPVYANVSAEPITDKAQIKESLLRQLYSPVRFEESIRNMLKEDIAAFVELGTGKVLSGLVRKIDRNIKTFAIQDPESLRDFISWYKGVS